MLRPRVLEAAIARAVDHFIRPRDSHSDHARCESLRRAVEKANGEQQRLVDAIAQGAGDVSALVGALRQRQELLLTVRSEPDGLKAPTAASFDREEIVNAAHAHAVDLQGLLRANTTEARRVLATRLDGRLTFTPKRDGRRQFYEFTGAGTIRPILGAILGGILEISITRYGVPTGIRTRVSALKGPRANGPCQPMRVRGDRQSAIERRLLQGRHDRAVRPERARCRARLAIAGRTSRLPV